MDENKLIAAIEAMLFTTGKAVKAVNMAKALDLPVSDINRAAETLMRRCEEEGRGVRCCG